MPKRSKWVKCGLIMTILGAIAIGYSLFHASVFLSDSSPWVMGDILFITAIIWLPIAVLSIIFKIREVINIKAFEAAMQIDIFARIVSKHIDNHYYYIKFECPDGTHKQFEVEYSLYASTFEKDTGTLTYKENGNKLFFIDFQLFKYPLHITKK